MEIRIPYSDNYKTLNVDEAKIKAVLTPGLDESAANTDESEIVKNALHNPIESKRLCDIVKGSKSFS